MNLSVSSTVCSTPAFTSQSNSNGAVEALEKVKMQLQDQLKQVNESKDDAKTKAEKIKAINEQLAQIDQQIQQAKLEAQQEKVQEAAAKNAAQAAKKQQTEESGDTGVVIAASLSQLVFASSKSTQLQSLNRVQNQLNGQINIAEMEIKQNAATGGSSTYQLNSIAENASQVAKTNQMIGSSIKSVQKATKAVDAAVQDAADATTTVKNKTSEEDEKTDDNLSTPDAAAKKEKHTAIDISV